MKLNLGCDDIRPLDWINIDSSLNANLQRIPFLGKLLSKVMGLKEYNTSNLVYMNLNNQWSYKDNSVDIVYSSHLFEHLTLKSANLYLSEAYRVLKPEGVLRIVVPDLYKICRKYIDEYNTDSFSGNSTDFIMWAINMHKEGQYGNIGLIKKLFLEIQGYPHQHKYMYDDKSLCSLVETYEFKDINFYSYGVSGSIEDIVSLEGTKESYLSIYLEAKKY